MVALIALVGTACWSGSSSSSCAEPAPAEGCPPRVTQPATPPALSPVLLTWSPANERPGKIDRSRAVEAARRFGLVVVSPGTFSAHLAAMRRINPRISIVVYLNAAFSQRGEGGKYPSSWYAYDAQGRKIRSVAFGNWLMDLSDPGWRRNRVAQCRALISGSAYDGCMLDVLGTAPLVPGYATGSPIDDRTGRVWEPRAWLAASSRIAHAVARRIEPAMVVANGLGNGVQYFDPGAPTSRLGRVADSVIAESWIRHPRQDLRSFPPVTRWTQDIMMLQDLERSGVQGLVLTKAWAPGSRRMKDRLHEFALASFLLVAEGRSRFHFSYSPGSDPTVGHPWWRVDIGVPSGSFQVVGHVYRRGFTEGIVLVNPTGVQRRIDLGSDLFTDLRGAQIRSGVLPPHTGVVLTRSAS